MRNDCELQRGCQKQFETPSFLSDGEAKDVYGGGELVARQIPERDAEIVLKHGSMVVFE
jgi:hypothetical protein